MSGVGTEGRDRPSVGPALGLDEARFCRRARPTAPCAPVAHAAQSLSAFGLSPPVAAMSEIRQCEMCVLWQGGCGVADGDTQTLQGYG